MNLFKRSKSIVSRSHDRQSDSTSTPSSSSSSLKPLVPQPTVSSQYPIPLKDDGVSLSDSSAASSTGRGFVGRKTGHRYPDDPKSHQYIPPDPASLVPPPRASPRSAKTIYANHPDMYTQNDLHTFSFGAAPSIHTPSSYQSVDPLMRPRDEADLDEGFQIPDTTPRPSVVGGAAHRTHPSHSSPARLNPPDRGVRASHKQRGPDSDVASNLGTSSASASVSSLANPRQSSRGTSQTSGRSNEASQTSSNDLTSDEEADGRHPFPPVALQPRPHGLRNRDQASSLYLSEEDFDNDNEDFDHDAMNARSAGKDFFQYANVGLRVEHHERRGSLARDIPSAQSDRSNISRDHYARRPSRSLEELSSFSFATPSGPSFTVRNMDERTLPIAPTSVPESEGDWRDLRKKSIQRDRESPFPYNPIANMPSINASGSDVNTNSSTAIPSGSSSANEFQWMQDYSNGVVAFDPSEVSDFLGDSRESLSAVRKGSSSTFRRQSTVSSVDIFTKRIVGWGGKKMKSQVELWAFTREKNRVDGDSANHHTGDNKERSSIVAAIFSPSRPSTSTSADGAATVSKSHIDKSDGKDKDKGKDKGSGKDKQTKEPWKGMSLDAEEIWNNGILGKFRVVRKNTISNEPGKPPQQRLNVSFMRTPYTFNFPHPEQHLEGPSVTIHKHSKAGAFSISRHFRTRSTGLLDSSSSHRHIASSSTQLVIRDSDVTEGGRKKANTMILLAPRRVQRAYTSTNTTRKLESHGLLDESGRTSPRDIERMRREHSLEERRRVKEGDKEKKKDKKDKSNGKEKEKELEKSKIKRKVAESSSRRSFGGKSEFAPKEPSARDPPLPDSSEGSSAGSVGIAIFSGDSDTLAKSSLSAVTTPESSLTVVSTGSIDSFAPSPSVYSHETTSSDLTIQRTVRSHQRKRGVYDIEDDDEDDDDSLDERRRYPARTPHRETYAALPPEVFENVHHEHPSHGIFGWGKSRSGDRNGHRINHYLEASYNPPWPTTLPRANSETRKFIVDDLNTSFQDVGLLPATGEIKSSSHSSHHKRKQRERQQARLAIRPADHQSTDIFQEVPEDSVYMLLPLWPGETDPVSAKTFPYPPLIIPTDKRQYLMIYYKTPFKAITLAESSKSKSSEKKRSRESSGTSGDHERTVFLSSFHISARIVSYRELQGTGVRIPDLGLAVCGRMEDAYASIPLSNVQHQSDYVIGMCHSRENGLEFVPEGFEKLGLATHAPNRALAEPVEDDDSQSAENVVILTPIGRAVMEMAWLGGMAVTSFNPSL